MVMDELLAQLRALLRLCEALTHQGRHSGVRVLEVEAFRDQRTVPIRGAIPFELALHVGDLFGGHGELRAHDFSLFQAEVVDFGEGVVLRQARGAARAARA